MLIKKVKTDITIILLNSFKYKTLTLRILLEEIIKVSEDERHKVGTVI